MMKEKYFDGLIETAIGFDPSAMYHLLNRIGMNSSVNTFGKDVEEMNSVISEEYMDDLIETAIGLDPAAMYQLLKRTGINAATKNIGNDYDQMNKSINEKYIDGLIENTIDVDPEAMHQVLQWMESIAPKSNNAKKELDLTAKKINEIYMDDLIETAIGFEPTAMYQLLNKMDSMIEHPEHDYAFSAYVDQLACGIDHQLKEYFVDLSSGLELENQSDLKLRSAIEINSNLILKMLSMEERLEETERNLAKLRKAEVIYADVI